MSEGEEREIGGPHPERGSREPIINAPPTIVILAVALCGLHLLVTSLVPSSEQFSFYLRWGFVPARIASANGDPSALLTWLTYAFLHGDWAHVLSNSLWLVVFGTPVLRRIGIVRFMPLVALGIVAAAAAHLYVYERQIIPMVGFSSAVSSLVGAAARFAFSQRIGPRFLPLEQRRRLSLLQTFSDKPTLGFIGVWMAANVLFGAGLIEPGGPSIAWEAHIGGFLLGLLAFAVFDRQPSLKRNVDMSGPSER